MNDLEICKRIADINGDKVLMMKSALGSNWMIAGEGHGGYKPYNPLTDDALCFKLMVKYEVQFNNHLRDGDTIANCDNGGHYVTQKNKSPNKAICLAIIEAHKDD